MGAMIPRPRSEAHSDVILHRLDTGDLNRLGDDFVERHGQANGMPLRA